VLESTQVGVTPQRRAVVVAAVEKVSVHLHDPWAVTTRLVISARSVTTFEEFAR
jgi:hypothetical protein